MRSHDQPLLLTLFLLLSVVGTLIHGIKIYVTSRSENSVFLESIKVAGCFIHISRCQYIV